MIYRFIVLQVIGIGCLVALYLVGLLDQVFVGSNAVFTIIIAGLGLIGLIPVWLGRWEDAEWVATHVVRIGLIGTVVGLISAFSAALQMDASDTEAVKEMIGAVIGGMYIALFATLTGLVCNVWLKLNIKLLTLR